MGTRWTEEEIEFVKKNRDKMSRERIALKLNRSSSAVYSMLQKLDSGLAEERKSRKQKKIDEVRPRKQCKTCIYKTRQGRGCDYILITGQRRGCSAENCDKYTRGKKKRMANEPAWSSGR